MLLLSCPNCGDRNASEFRYGGPLNPRPVDPEKAEEDSWIRYLYLQANTMEHETEWWYHRYGCGLWFLVERNRKNNDVIRTYQWQVGGQGGRLSRV